MRTMYCLRSGSRSSLIICASRIALPDGVPPFGPLASIAILIFALLLYAGAVTRSEPQPLPPVGGKIDMPIGN